MEMSIFFRDCPAPIIGITGTKGKTTVSALIGTILQAWKPDALLAGNMGISALLELDRLTPDTPVALELSSFQIESLNDHRLAPHVAVFHQHLSRPPRPLSRFRALRRYQAGHGAMDGSGSDIVVFNADDPETVGGSHGGHAGAAAVRSGSAPDRGDWRLAGRGPAGLWFDGDRRLEFTATGRSSRWQATTAPAMRWRRSPRLLPTASRKARSGRDLAAFQGVENRLEIVARRRWRDLCQRHFGNGTGGGDGRRQGAFAPGRKHSTSLPAAPTSAPTCRRLPMSCRTARMCRSTCWKAPPRPACGTAGRTRTCQFPVHLTAWPAVVALPPRRQSTGDIVAFARPAPALACSATSSTGAGSSGTPCGHCRTLNRTASQSRKDHLVTDSQPARIAGFHCPRYRQTSISSASAASA